MFRSYLHSKSIDYVMEISFKILRVVSQKYICFIATWAIFGVAYVNNYPSFVLRYVRERYIYINMKVPEILFGFLLKSKVRN